MLKPELSRSGAAVGWIVQHPCHHCDHKRLCCFPLVPMLNRTSTGAVQRKAFCTLPHSAPTAPLGAVMVTPGPWAVTHWTPAGLTALTSYSHLQDNSVPGAAHTSNKSTTPPLHPHASTGCHFQPLCHLHLSPLCFWCFGPKSLYSVLTQRKNFITNHIKMMNLSNDPRVCITSQRHSQHPQLFVGISRLLSQVPAFMTFALWCMKLLCGCYSTNLN